MRGDQSPPTQRLQSLTHPPQKEREAALCKKSYLPKHKNFPKVHPPQTKRIKSSPCKGGCAWGKFSVREGGLEGESPVFQEGALSLQGLPTPPSKVFLPFPHPLHTSRRRGDNAGPVRVVDDKARLRTRRLFDVFCKRVVHLRVRRARRRRGSL